MKVKLLLLISLLVLAIGLGRAALQRGDDSLVILTLNGHYPGQVEEYLV